MTILRETTASAIEKGWITFDTRDGELKVALRPGHRPDGLGAAARLRRGLLRRPSRRRTARRRSRPAPASSSPAPTGSPIPKLSPTFESTVPGIYVIGALAGYPLIKHCMNQGYDVVEFINGNTALKPADEPILEEKFAGLPGQRSVEEWLDFLRAASRSSTRCRRCRCASSCSIQRAGLLPRRRRRSSSATSPAPRCSRSPTARCWSRSTRPIPRSPCRSAGLDLRRGRPDLGPQARRHGPRRRGRDRGRDPAQRGAEADVDGAGGEARDHPHLDRAAAAADVRLGPHPGGSGRGARERRDRRASRRARRSSTRARRATTSSSSARARWSSRRISAASRSSSPTCRPAPMSARWR